MFVSLDRLLPMDLEPAQPEIQPPGPTDGRRHQMVTRSQGYDGRPSQQDFQQQKPRNRSPVPQQLLFKCGDRVVVHDKQGHGIYGSVQWISDVMYAGENILAVGIETVIVTEQYKLHVQYVCELQL